MSIESKALFTLEASVAEPQVTAKGPYGERRYIPVTGGKVSGERISGVLLPGGADCQLVRPDGVIEMDVRVTIQTDDGETILMKTLGLRHAKEEVLKRMMTGDKVERSEYYFREFVIFEAPDGQYSWLNKLIAIGDGERRPDLVILDVFEIL